MKRSSKPLGERPWFTGVVCALISGVCAIIAGNINLVIVPTRDADQPEEFVTEEPPVNRAVFAETSDSQGDVLRAFGAWEERQHNVAYRAETDGFAVAYSRGNDPVDNIWISVGTSPEDLFTTSRARQYDGAVSPIPKDHYWVAATRGGSGVQVRWLAINSN